MSFLPSLALVFSPFSMPMVLESSQISKQTVLEYRVTLDNPLDILDHVDIYRSSRSSHTLAHLNKSSRIHAANSNKFVRILLE